MNSTKKIRIWLKTQPPSFYSVLCKWLAVFIFIAWVLLSQGCATNLGEGPVKLREYMAKGITFTNEAGAHGNTQ